MGKSNPPKVVILQWFGLPSMPLDIILLGFVDLLSPLSHLLHAYSLLVALLATCSTLGGLPYALYHM